ncbi:component of SufBCD complex [Roseovarius albus]|uniref:component of SufBCD complex n=1 Tax=Roseovarius albus TaxID=1247867 RepID=UPI000A269E14|nr:component of SufBCD complex [Roseovarius albus]
MDWYSRVFELIDMRSFSNLWFWISLAVLWSTTSHWVLGVPWDMAMRAKRKTTEQNVADFEDVVRANVNRIIYIIEESGIFLVGFVFFILTFLCLAGFVYLNELSQALFLLAFPMSLVGLLTMRTAFIIRDNELRGDELIKRLQGHRQITQLLGVIAIFVTAMWGMWQNLSHSIIG